MYIHIPICLYKSPLRHHGVLLIPAAAPVDESRVRTMTLAHTPVMIALLPLQIQVPLALGTSELG